MQEFRVRRSSRIFLFDERGDILLIRFVAERDGSPYIFWVTPGGEVEPGEDDRTAAERELYEELGLKLTLTGPVHQESGGTYVHLGETVHNFDVFFAAQCRREDPKLAGVTAEEIALMSAAKWWSIRELQSTTERIFPAAITDLVQRVWIDLIGRKYR